MQTKTYSTDKQVAKRYKVGRATPWRWAKGKRGFPKPIRFSPGCSRWDDDELDKWDAEQQAS